MTTETVLMPDSDGAGEIVEFCVQPGEKVTAGDALLVLESDKASMEVPSPADGIVNDWLVEIGAVVSSGMPLLELARQPQPKHEANEVVQHADIAEHKQTVGIHEPVVLTMPDAGGAGEAVEVAIKAGDRIAVGDTLLVLESDKASMEVPAEQTGEVCDVMIREGDTLKTGMPIAKVLPLGEAQVVTQVAAVPDAKPVKAANNKSIEPRHTADNKPISVDDTATRKRHPGQMTAVNAGPAVRKLARELGIDLVQVTGKGRRGRIRKEDLKVHVKQQLAQASQLGADNHSRQGIPSIPLEDFSRYGEIEQQDMTSIAKATVAHMTRCWLNIPHVTLFDEVNIDDLETFRRSIDPEALDLPRKPTLLPFMIAVVARALQQFPQFNVSLDPENDQIIRKTYINIGFAVDSPAGLVVPVIRDADKKSIRQLAQEVTALSAKARVRKLTVADMQGGCFTLSSMGAIGGTGFTPIINGPEVAILGIAKSAIKPLWDGEHFKPATQLPLCLSFDHRAINGGDAGRFMAYIHATLSDIRRTLL